MKSMNRRRTIQLTAVLLLMLSAVAVGVFTLNSHVFKAHAATTPTATGTPIPVIGAVSKTWYFAEGRVGAGFREYLTVDNPSAVPCAANFKYLYTVDQTTATLTKVVTAPVAPATRLTESVNLDLATPDPMTPASAVAAIVTVDASTPNCQGFVVERPMYMTNYHGLNSGTDVLGSITLSKTFAFADVPTGSGYSSYLTILNSNTVTANVVATYYAGGKVVATQTLPVGATSRGTIVPGNATPTLPTHVSAIVTSDQPIVVERPSYLTNVNGLSGAADVMGAQALSNDWLFAEGYAASSSQEFLTIGNVSTATAANVTITLKSKTGITQQFPITVAAQSQVIWNVNANNTFSGASPEVSAEVTSTGTSVVVQREMFYHYVHILLTSLQTLSFTDVMGLPAASIKHVYSFAEGYTHTNYHEWLTIQNPTATDEIMNIVIINGNSKILIGSFTVLANSRYTADITAIMESSQILPGDIPGNEISLAVGTQSTTAVFVAERPMYFNTAGTPYVVSGGTDVIGFGG